MVSVVIPTYNRANKIERAVRSVLNQTYSDLECIVVDDGSTDNTQQVVEAIIDPRLKYARLPEGKGANAARNYGVSISTGEYIAFQDSDDVWKAEKLEKQLALLNQHKADIVSCTYVSLQEEPFNFWNHFENSRMLCFLDFFPGNVVGTPTLLAIRECFVSFSFDTTLPRLQDHELVIRLITKFKLWFDLEPLVLVDKEGERISSDNMKFVDAMKMLFDKVANMEWLQDEKNEALSRWFKSFMPFWFYYQDAIKTIEEQQRTIEEQQRTIEEQQKISEYYENTTSWKITKPLRETMDFIKSFR